MSPYKCINKVILTNPINQIILFLYKIDGWKNKINKIINVIHSFLHGVIFTNLANQVLEFHSGSCQGVIHIPKGMDGKVGLHLLGNANLICGVIGPPQDSRTVLVGFGGCRFEEEHNRARARTYEDHTKGDPLWMLAGSLGYF